MNYEKIPLYCPKCKKMLAKLDEKGYCRNILLYCKRCKQEYKITYEKSNRANESEPSD